MLYSSTLTFVSLDHDLFNKTLLFIYNNSMISVTFIQLCRYINHIIAVLLRCICSLVHNFPPSSVYSPNLLCPWRCVISHLELICSSQDISGFVPAISVPQLPGSSPGALFNRGRLYLHWVYRITVLIPSFRKRRFSKVLRIYVYNKLSQLYCIKVLWIIIQKICSGSSR